MTVTALVLGVVAGLALASVYVLIAISVTLVLAVSGIFNFAQGSIVMLGTILSFILGVQLAWAAPTATCLTKYSLNNWMRVAWPIFATSMALEMLTFGGPVAKEGLSAHIEKREPNFDPHSPV